MTSKLNDFGLLILRSAFGLIMLAAHGYPKLLKLMSGNEIKFFDPFGIGKTFSLILATSAEFVGAALLTLGIFSRLSSLSLAITMFVAAFIYHADDPFKGQEKAILFFTGYVVLFITGPGKYSLQKFIDNKLQTKNGALKFLFG
jgi:putative oxidoreductase